MIRDQDMIVKSTPIRLGLFLILATGLFLLASGEVFSKDDLEREHLDPGTIAEEINQIRGELSKIRQQFENQLNAVEHKLNDLDSRLNKFTTGTQSSQRTGQMSEPGAANQRAPDNRPTVCREGCQFSDLNKAIEATKSGGTITVAPGIQGTCGVIRKPIRLIGLKDPSGKRAHLAGSVCWGKASLVIVASDVFIEGFEISNVTVNDRNGACVRIDPGAGDVVIRDLYCHDSENGVLGGPLKGIITIENSIFERNGANRGHAHGIYISQGDVFILRNSQILSTKGQGHSLKSGAKRTIIENSVIAALDGANSRAVDAFGGGEVVIRRSVIQQGKNSDNNDALGIALEPRRINPAPHSTTLEDNWLIFDDRSRCCRLLFQAKQFGPFTVRGNRIVAMTDIADSPLELEEAENQFYSDRKSAKLPEYDGTLSSLPKPGLFH